MRFRRFGFQHSCLPQTNSSRLLPSHQLSSSPCSETPSLQFPSSLRSCFSDTRNLHRRILISAVPSATMNLVTCNCYSRLLFFQLQYKLVKQLTVKDHIISVKFFGKTTSSQSLNLWQRYIICIPRV